jgi:hypothetical protein
LCCCRIMGSEVDRKLATRAAGDRCDPHRPYA